MYEKNYNQVFIAVICVPYGNNIKNYHWKVFNDKIKRIHNKLYSILIVNISKTHQSLCDKQIKFMLTICTGAKFRKKGVIKIRNSFKLITSKSFYIKKWTKLDSLLDYKS